MARTERLADRIAAIAEREAALLVNAERDDARAGALLVNAESDAARAAAVIATIDEREAAREAARAAALLVNAERDAHDTLAAALVVKKFEDYGTSMRSVIHIPEVEFHEMSIFSQRSDKQNMILGASVQAVVSQEWPTGVSANAIGRLNNDIRLPEWPRAWTGGPGGAETNRVDVRFPCIEWWSGIIKCNWVITVDMWGTPITGDKIHLRTILDVRGAAENVWVTDDAGLVVSKYFTPTEEEIAQNTGSLYGCFYFTCVVQSTKYE
jgi:hypothetical protein